MGVKNLSIVRVLEREGWVEFDLENFMYTSKDLDGKKILTAVMAEDVAVAHGRVRSGRGCCLKDQQRAGTEKTGWEDGGEWTWTNLEVARRFLVWGEYEFRVDPTRVIAEDHARLAGRLCSLGWVAMAGRLSVQQPGRQL